MTLERNQRVSQLVSGIGELGRHLLNRPLLDLNLGSTLSFAGKATKANAFTITP